MPTRVRPRAIVEEVYGFTFPDDLFAFEDFVHANPSATETLDISLDGPFALIEGREKKPTKKWDPRGAWPRFFNDPPEFFTVATGSSDGLHWGYWFDDPDALAPVVTHYHHNDAFELTVDGDTIFHAARRQLEGLYASAQEDLQSDPDHADDYRAAIGALDATRDALGKYALGDRTATGRTYLQAVARKPDTSRKPVALTRNKLGIVVAKNQYRALSGADALDAPNYKPKTADVRALATAAKAALAEGLPGAALKLGHDLWSLPGCAEQSYELLDVAYGALGRRTLKSALERIVLFRRQADDKRIG